MRDANRLDSLYNEICQTHKEKMADIRIGQLIVIFYSWYVQTYKTDPFYAEDDKFIERFRKFIEETVNT